jgi:cobalt/nickel transport system permease protein
VTPVHALAAHVKLVATGLFVLVVVATPREAMWALAGLAAMVLAVAAMARIPPSALVRRLALEVPFLAFAIALPFVARGERVDVLGLELSSDGLWAAWNIFAKATIGIAASTVLISTTPIADLLRGLDRLRVPRVVTAIAGFMVRYLDVVTGELRRMRIARVSRGHNPRWLWQARAVASTAGTLFVRSFERGERIHVAMISRGYSGAMPILVGADPTPSRAQWGAALAVPAAALVVCLTAWVMR